MKKERQNAEMLLKKLRMDYFGKFTGKEIDLQPGINLIYGENEAGKSTLHTFIKGMLFGIERLRGRGAASKDDTYTRYLPWKYPGAYGGQMDIEMNDKKYRLQRSFHANDKSFTILDLNTGREVKLKEGHIRELIPGLTETAFRNTISIGQLRAETDGELASHVRNYITNLSIAKSKEVDIEKAINSLKIQKKALESMSFTSQIKTLSDEIEEGIEREKKIDSLTADLKELEGREIRLKEQIGIHKAIKNKKEEELIGELPAILERYRIYQELSRQYSKLDTQIENLRLRISGLEQKADKEIDVKKSFLYIGISIVAAILGFYITRSLIVSTGILMAAFVIGRILRVNSLKRIEKEEHLKTSLTLEHAGEQLKELINRRKHVEDQCDEFHDTVMIYMQKFISEEELTPEAVYRLQEAIHVKKTEIQKEQSELNLQVEECRIQIEKIRWELSRLEDNEAELIKNKEQYTYLLQKEEENKAERDAINLALSTIGELSATIHDSFGIQLNKAVSVIIDEVTNHRYKDIKIDEKLNIKLGWNDNYILLDRLSAGTIDQVYLALRLAVADLLLGTNNMPLMLDDSFALYDDSRVKAALTQMASRSQVILFSCQMREKLILEELGLPYNYIKL